MKPFPKLFGWASTGALVLQQFVPYLPEGKFSKWGQGALAITTLLAHSGTGSGPFWPRIFSAFVSSK